jgi:hypothetical protein
MTVISRYLKSVGPTHWSYRTAHKAADLLAPGYWDEAANPPDMVWGATLTTGDFIFVSGPNWAMILHVFQSTPVIVGVMTALGAVGELPLIEYPEGVLT